jgi:predicted Zn finger-like uncharacterized protein/prepilin-type processing-associated H-X9-DG protein
MSQLITCPQCGQTYTITPRQVPQYQGRTIQCTKCGRPFTVNIPMAEEVVPPLPPTPEPGPVKAHGFPVTQQQPVFPQQQPPAFPPSYAYQTAAPPPKASGLAVASLVFACIGLILPLVGIIGIILGIIALLKTRDPNVGGRGIAIAGVSVGGASILTTACAISIFVPAFHRANETANRVKCASNLRMIGQAILMYSNDNRGQYPPTPDLLLLTQDIQPDAFCCPSTNDKPVTGDQVQQAKKQPNTTPLLVPGKSSYVYWGKGLTNNASAEAVVVYEDSANHDDEGGNFLFGDGHVEFEDKAHADAIVAELKSGNNPPRWKVVQQAAQSAGAKR